MTETQPPPSSRRSALRGFITRLWSDPFGRVFIFSTSASFLLLAGLIVFALLYFRRDEPAEPPEPETTPSVTLAPHSSGQDEGEALITSGEISVSGTFPTSLSVRDEPYTLIPVRVSEDGRLVLPDGPEQTAYWVYGSLVNFVIGFPNLSNNAVSLGSLRPGDLIQLGLDRGEVLEFRVTEKLRVSPTATDLLAQSHPGLTLFLVGGVMTDRLIITAEYVLPFEAQAGSGEPAGLNEPGRIGNLEIRVEAVRLVARPLDVPPGWSYLIVDYSVAHSGDSAFTASGINSTLSDARGNAYSPVLQALTYATYPALPREISAGGTLQASVGYLVPIDLTGPNLLWRFYPDAASESYAAFTLPFTTVAARIVVELTSALASVDSRDLIINGVIYNPSDVAVTLTRTDISLLADTGEVVALRFADPGLPWNIGPQASPQAFTLTFVRPASTTAALHILDFVFEIHLDS